jgi:hypothetical protein
MRSRESRGGSRVETRIQQRRTNQITTSLLNSDEDGPSKQSLPSLFQVDISDDDEEVYKPRKRARVTRRTVRRRTIRSKVAGVRSSLEESSSFDMKGLVVPDSEMDEESAADVDDNDQSNDQPDDPSDASSPELDLCFRNLSQLGAGDPMETNQDAFKTYVTGHVLSFLDSRFRDALVGNADAREFRGQVASLK